MFRKKLTFKKLQKFLFGLFQDRNLLNFGVPNNQISVSQKPKFYSVFVLPTTKFYSIFVSLTTKFYSILVFNEYILPAVSGPLEQLSETPKWSKFGCLGHQNVEKSAWGHQNEVKLVCWGHPNRVNFWLSGTPKQRKVCLLGTPKPSKI